MTVITDNVRTGAVVGTGQALFNPSKLIVLVGDPSDVVTGNVGSDIAWDKENGQAYMCRPTGGSTWIKLGSIA